ncbi:UNVERIFIED_CONTAM: putative integral membrane protein [Jeotgalibacillus campisalis]
MESSAKIRRLAIKEEMRKAADVAEEAANSQAFAAVARAGYAVSGLLHMLIGAIAIQLAVGRGGEADVSGAVTELANKPAGPLLLWACFAACAALALWQLGNAILGYRIASDNKLTKRLSALGQALVFAALAATIMSFVVGRGQNSRESSSDFTVTLMKAPFGVFLLVAIGAGIAITGIVFAVRGFRRKFTKDLSLSSSPGVHKFQLWVGVVGYIAKGIALFLVGLLVVIAAVRAQPEQSTGLDGSLKALKEQPYGPYLLAAVALGLIAYGLFLMVKARTLRT